MNNLNNKKLIIFDLDDTLYLERDYVLSGFDFISDVFSKKYQINKTNISEYLFFTFTNEGRERIFNKLYEYFNIDYNEQDIRFLVESYRNHQPKISLSIQYQSLLNEIKEKFHIALVTDGSPIIQKNKVRALGLDNIFDFIVYCWEIDAPKPSVKGFELAMSHFKCTNKETLIIGDNPEHDVVAACKLHVDCYRIHTGRFDLLPDFVGYQSTQHFNSLNEIFG